MKPYKLPEKYLPYKIFEQHRELMKMVLAVKISSKFDLLSQASIAQNLAYLYKLWEEGYPLYCVRSSLMEDMLATDVGENLALFEHIELDMPCFALFFPQGKVLSPFGGSIDYLIVNHEKIDTHEHKHLISWGGIDSKARVVLSAKRIRKDGILKRSHFSSKDEQVQERSLTIRNLVLQSILLLQYYPQIVYEYQEKELKGFAAKPLHDSSYNQPRWLGEFSRKSIKSSQGAGRGKRTHFRRGHWRIVNSKRIHIRPAWVNN